MTINEKTSKLSKPNGCDSCGFETENLTLYETRNTVPGTGTKWLCDLCAETLTGTAYDFPDSYPEGRVMQTICYVGNVILRELRKGRRQ